MELQYTPEQIQLRKTVRDFAEQEIAPHVLEWDEAEIFPLDTIKKAGELGLLGAIFRPATSPSDVISTSSKRSSAIVSSCYPTSRPMANCRSGCI